MAEYIEREKLTKHIEDEIEAFGNPSESQNPLAYGGVLALKYCKSIAVTLPTADVVEVRHGEWREANKQYPRYVCTACNHLFNNKNYNYCPCCGAKMDGERKKQG
jgi:rubrerythrin